MNSTVRELVERQATLQRLATLEERRADVSIKHLASEHGTGYGVANRQIQDQGTKAGSHISGVHLAAAWQESGEQPRKLR